MQILQVWLSHILDTNTLYRIYCYLCLCTRTHNRERESCLYCTLTLSQALYLFRHLSAPLPPICICSHLLAPSHEPLEPAEHQRASEQYLQSLKYVGKINMRLTVRKPVAGVLASSRAQTCMHNYKYIFTAVQVHIFTACPVRCVIVRRANVYAR